MTRSRQFLYLTFSGLAGLLALTVLACSSDFWRRACGVSCSQNWRHFYSEESGGVF